MSGKGVTRSRGRVARSTASRRSAGTTDAGSSATEAHAAPAEPSPADEPRADATPQLEEARARARARRSVSADRPRPVHLGRHNDKWDSRGFSDPRYHDPSAYVYLATSFIRPGRFPLHTTEIGRERQWIFCSLVSDQKNRTWFKAGLLLDIRPENMIHALPQDSATTCYPEAKDIADARRLLFETDEYGDEYVWDAKAWPPSRIIEQTRMDIDGRHNEVLAYGEGEEGHIVGVIGVWYREGFDLGNPLHVELREYARRHGLPEVIFPKFQYVVDPDT